MIDLSKRIRELRTTSKVSQSELGERLGCPKQKISYVESGRYKGSSVEFYQRVGDALGYDLDFVKRRPPKQTTDIQELR